MSASLPSARQHPSYGDCLEVESNENATLGLYTFKFGGKLANLGQLRTTKVCKHRRLCLCTHACLPLVDDMVGLFILESSCKIIQCESKNTFCNTFTQAKCIYVKFYQFVASLYPYTFTNFDRLIFIFNKMALNFLEALIVFTVSKFRFSPSQTA